MIFILSVQNITLYLWIKIGLKQRRVIVDSEEIQGAWISNDTLTDQENIIDGKPDSQKTYHCGCKLQFDKEDYLWFGIGDRNELDFSLNV